MYSSNFGVIEVASAKTTSAPGWAYVPDTGVHLTHAALQPSNRKRARNQGATLSGADLTARQEAKVRKELETLERDSNRDIPLPPRTGAVSRASKSTPAVRKILQSQKTFANHFDDYMALMSQAESLPTSHGNQHTVRPPQPNQHSKRVSQGALKRPSQPNQHTKRNAAAIAVASPAPLKKTETLARSRSKGSLKSELEVESHGSEQLDDVDMLDADVAGEEDPTTPILTPYDKLPPPEHPGDTDPLLISVVPGLPSNDELRALIAHPPLTYTQARAAWGPNDRRYPARRFCDVCGYWGRTGCMKCGIRVCALDCLEMHREGCLQRYGA